MPSQRVRARFAIDKAEPNLNTSLHASSLHLINIAVMSKRPLAVYLFQEKLSSGFSASSTNTLISIQESIEHVLMIVRVILAMMALSFQLDRRQAHAQMVLQSIDGYLAAIPYVLYCCCECHHNMSHEHSLLCRSNCRVVCWAAGCHGAGWGDSSCLDLPCFLAHAAVAAPAKGMARQDHGEFRPTKCQR